MINLGLLANCTYYRYYVEPYIAVDATILNIVVDGQTETLQFTIVNGFLWAPI